MFNLRFSSAGDSGTVDLNAAFLLTKDEKADVDRFLLHLEWLSAQGSWPLRLVGFEDYSPPREFKRLQVVERSTPVAAPVFTLQVTHREAWLLILKGRVGYDDPAWGAFLYWFHTREDPGCDVFVDTIDAPDLQRTVSELCRGSQDFGLLYWVPDIAPSRRGP